MTSLAWSCLPAVVACDTWLHLVPSASLAEMATAFLAVAALILSAAIIGGVFSVSSCRFRLPLGQRRKRIVERGQEIVDRVESVLLASGDGARAPGDGPASSRATAWS